MAGVYDDTLTYITGEPIRGGTVTVYNAGTNTVATLYSISDTATEISNPQTTSDVGRISFAAQQGLYDLRVQTPYGEWTIEDVSVPGESFTGKWSLSDQVSLSFTTNNINSYLQAYGDFIDTYVDGWSVCDSVAVSSVARQIMLKPSTGDQRIAIFGGATVAAANRWVNSYTNGVYICLHPTFGADAFSANFNSAQVMSGADFIDGVIWDKSMSDGAAARCAYKSDCLILSIGGDVQHCLVGAFARDDDGNAVYGNSGGGGNFPYQTTVFESISTVGLFMPEDGTTTAGLGQRCLLSTGAIDSWGRGFDTADSLILSQRRYRDGTPVLSKIACFDSSGYAVGIADEIYVGPDAQCWSTEVVDGITFARVSASESTAGNALWLPLST